jgi:phage protein U
MTTSWRRIGASEGLGMNGAPARGLSLQTTDPIIPQLYKWGPLSFRTWPVNVYELDHDTDTDWAQKEIAGAAIYREWVGENDETIFFRGKLFPYRLGGFAEIEIFEANRRAGLAQMLLRGTNPSFNMGWFVCEKLVRSHTFLSAEGIGQQIAFEAQMARVPTPSYQETFLGDNQRVGNWLS